MTIKHLALTVTLCCALPTFALAQGAPPSASTLGAGSASGNSGTVGSGGSAAAGGTSASTLGMGAKSGDSQSLGSAGSAAAVDGRATSKTKMNDNNAMSKARAQDGGTWSRSMTKTKIKDDTLTSRTKAMAHQPGGPPVKSKTNTTTTLGQ